MANLRAAFEFFDKNGDGYLTRDELTSNATADHLWYEQLDRILFEAIVSTEITRPGAALGRNRLMIQV